MILYSISYSPWSLRARWALKHHDVTYERREYIPMVSTPHVRWQVSDWHGPITVPLLIDGATILRSSDAIARFADERGNGPSLFEDSDEVVNAWTEISEQIASPGRALTTFAVGESREATLENVPPFVPKPARRFATPIVALGSRYLAQKYDFTDADRAAATDTMRAALERVANRLVESDTLGNSFGWSDMAVASALQFVRPAETWAKLGPASRRCWTRPDLAEEFADVLTWRDSLLREHRK